MLQISMHGGLKITQKVSFLRAKRANCILHFAWIFRMSFKKANFQMYLYHCDHMWYHDRFASYVVVVGSSSFVGWMVICALHDFLRTFTHEM